MSIDADRVDEILRLARLELDPSERCRMQQDLAVILDYVSTIEHLDTSDVSPLHNPVEIDENITRPDDAHASRLHERFLQSAPEREGPYVVVPRVVGDGVSEDV